MRFETSIYGEVEIPIPQAGLEDLRALRKRRPRVRVEVQRGDYKFLLPLHTIQMGDPSNPDAEPAYRKIRGVKFG